jgi:hypothetical protein
MKHTAPHSNAKKAISETSAGRTEALDKEQINMVWKDFYSKEVANQQTDNPRNTSRTTFQEPQSISQSVHH